jgi:acid phosphatase (class A)
MHVSFFRKGGAKMKKPCVWGIAVVFVAAWFAVTPVFATDLMDGAFMVDNVKVYIHPAKFDSTRYLSAPPTGIEEREDMRIVERWQEVRTKAMADKSLADSEQSVFIFADVVSEKFTGKYFPIAKKFFNSVYKTESNLNKQGKEKWERMRPPAINPNLKAVGKFESMGSYPSGHAAFGWLTGIVLADMLPEMRDAIMMRAREISLNRVVGGVHYPSDIEAGRMLAVACAVEIRNNPAFLADFEEARMEVRKGLGLPLK